MNKNIGPYQVVDLPRGRRVWLNALHLSGPTYFMYGLLEVDVTLPKQLITEYKARSGETLSFTGFLVYCLAKAVDENKSVQAYLKGRKQLVLFEDVNVGLMVEHQDGGKGTLMGRTIYGANHKTYRQIHEEIRSTQTASVPRGKGMPRWFLNAMLLPWPFSSLVRTFMRIATRKDPTLRVAATGTVDVTAVGMFGKGHSGWALTTTPTSLSMMVGTICWKPSVIDGRIEPREILNLTLVFDHDVIDGAPATRFTKRLLELIEDGYGLQEMTEHEPLGENIMLAREVEEDLVPAA